MSKRTNPKMKKHLQTNRNNNKKTPPKNRTKRKHSEESKPIKQIKLMTTKYLE